MAYRCLLVLLAVTALAAQSGPELLVNPGFDLDTDQNGLPDGWNTSAETTIRREIVAFGGDFELVSRPGKYVLATQELKLVPGETYTLMLEARGSGGGRAGGLLLHGATRPITEFPLIWQQALEADYHAYYKVFVAPNPVVRLHLYNVARAGEVAYRRVSLRQGTPDMPLVQTASFGPMDRPEEPVVTPHLPWARPLAGGPLKSLFVMSQLRSLREPVELAQRCELDYDVMQTGDGEAVSPSGLRVQERLAANGYDVYAINSNLRPPLQKAIGEAVRGGKGLVVLRGFAPGNVLFPPDSLPLVPADHPLRRGLPWEMLPAAAIPQLRAGALGQGRAVLLAYNWQTTRVWGILPALLGQSEWEVRTFRYWEYWHALLARCLVWAAGRELDLALSARADEAGVTVDAPSLPAG
ncbi:MAG: hypothetical protein HUU35_15265, partial [Armatimonadetes bacterium]|nr:hypothetical protein [Armatimonadota bacterium]